MSEFQGTKGPWVTADAHGPIEGGDCIQELSSGRDNFVAVCCHYTSRDAVKANACLIAAAPDLLEALQKMVTAYEYEASIDNPALLAARAAITKALGETK